MRAYGNLSLTDASPAQTFTEPATLSEVKAFLNLPERSPADSAEDTMLEGFIAGAREQAETLQNRDLIEKQYDLSLDWFPSEIELQRPLVSVDLITYKDSDGVTTTLVEDTDFIVDLARGLVRPPYGETWPTFTAWPTSAVLVRFTSGYSSTHPFWLDSGERIKIGMYHLISHWYTGRLPFEMGVLAASEYPFTVTQLLTSGAIPRRHV